MGLTGPPTILEGKKGFWRTFADNDVDPQKLTSGPGQEFIVVGMSFKPYASCHQIQAPIEATARIVNEYNVRADQIEEIVAGTNAHALDVVGAIREPRDITAAQFSAPFGLKLQVVKGGNGFREYVDENLTDPEVLALARRVRMEADPEIEAEFPKKRSVKVTIKLKNGTSYQLKLDGPRGSPQNPMTRAEIEEKFASLASLVFPEKRIRQIVDTIHSLESLGTVARLTRLLVN
ncbi:MAG: MmgE/PrpD family protein [Chloroflexi bacterium]|nr:MmgE/PrpD family protein [Chloroflexota bacterium]